MVVSFICRACDGHGHVGGVVSLEACPYCGSDALRAHPEILSLSLLHLDCDAYYASIEKRDNPALHDVPVIVGGGDRGVVAAACYVARQYGIHSAMPAWRAKALCPELHVIKPRMALYTQESRKIRALMLEATPLVQPLSIDEAFLDLSGTEQLHGAPPAVTASKLQKRIFNEVGITVSIGLSGNKSLAKMASDRDKPHGFFTIGMAEAKDWLAPQSVKVLYGMGKASVARMQDAGIQSCQDLVEAEPALLNKLLGSDAMRIRNLAMGVDPRPVEPDQKAKSISAETTFRRDLNDFDSLMSELEPLIERVSQQLKAKNLSAMRVVLKLKTADHKLLSRSKTVQEPVQFAHHIHALVSALLQAEMKSARHYRLIGVGVEKFAETLMAAGLDIAPEAEKRRQALEEATDKLREKLGKNTLQSGRRLLYQKHDGQKHDGQKHDGQKHDGWQRKKDKDTK